MFLNLPFRRADQCSQVSRRMPRAGEKLHHVLPDSQDRRGSRLIWHGVVS